MVGSYQCDIDIRPFYYCKKHKQDVNNSLLWAIIGVMELSDAALGLTNKKMKKTRFKITRHAAGKPTTTKGGSKKMSAKPNLGGKTTNTGTPDRKGKRKNKN